MDLCPPTGDISVLRVLPQGSEMMENANLLFYFYVFENIFSMARVKLQLLASHYLDLYVSVQVCLKWVEK